MKRVLIFALMVFWATGISGQIHLEKYNFGEGLQFTGDSGYKMQLDGYIQPYLETRKFSNSDDLYNRFRMRRFRVRLSGTSENEKFKYRLQVDLSGSTEADVDEGGNTMLLDGFVSYDINENYTVTFGQKATPTDNLELGMSSQTLQLPERSRVTSVFSSIREFGVFIDASYKIRGTDVHIKPSFAVTNGDGMNVFKKDRGGLKYGGRINVLPLGLFRNFGQFRQGDMMRELTPKLLIGFTYSYNNGISDRRGRETGSILYLDADGNEALPDYEKFGIDMLFKYKGFSLLGEYVKANAHVGDDITQRVRTDGSVTPDFAINGIQDVDNYIKNRMMLGSGFNLQAGYIFKNLWSVDARYTHLKADQYSYLNNAAFYARPNYYTVGITKYLGKNYGAKIQLAGTYVDADPTATDNDGILINGHEWIGTLVFTVGF